MTPTHAEFHVLRFLMEGPRHGYGIMQDVVSMSDGRLNVVPGTFYSMIKRLLNADVIEECEPDAERRRVAAGTASSSEAAAGNVTRRSTPPSSGLGSLDAGRPQVSTEM